MEKLFFLLINNDKSIEIFVEDVEVEDFYEPISTFILPEICDNSAT